MRKQWIVNAPNGRHVNLTTGGGQNAKFEHRAIIENEALALQFPKIFIPAFVESGPPIEEKELLVEPAPVEELVTAEAEPALTLEDTILTEPAPVEKLKVTEKKSKKNSKKKKGYYGTDQELLEEDKE